MVIRVFKLILMKSDCSTHIPECCQDACLQRNRCLILASVSLMRDD